MKRVLFLLFAVAAGLPAMAQAPATSFAPPGAQPLADVPVLAVPALDLKQVEAEDLAREASGLPPRFAVPNAVDVTPAERGLWEDIGGGDLMWRLRIQAPNAGSINLGFTDYVLPDGAQLLIYGANTGHVIGPFTPADNALHQELWTPVILTDDVIVELTLPAASLAGLGLELTHVGSGYRGFGIPDKRAGATKSGSCNVDVVCPEGTGWEAEIGAVGVISTGGSTFCTGFMVNNTANDRKPYFMTANHCGISAGNAASLVVYWNYETTVCGGSPDGSLGQFQTGSFFRSSYGASDFTLVELDSAPNPAWDVTFAGWDRTGAEATTAIAIHHPSTDEKRISFEFQPTTTTDYLGTSVPGNGTHVRVEDWDVGTTEPGSSGSPLFDQNHRVIGQLHGGYAACGNDDADWYGRFSVSWTGGGTPSSRLLDWLDPAGTGATAVDSLGVGLSAAPSVATSHEGPITGPFTNATVPYTLKNQTTAPLIYSVSLGAGAGLELQGGTSPVFGTLNPGDSVVVTATVSAAANTFGVGEYTAELVFDDLTNLETSSSLHHFTVGKTTAISFDFSSDPGWTTTGAWAFGQPTGGGGQSYGNPDPTSGATGTNVYGYNLAGDYTNNLTPKYLYSNPIDLSGLTSSTLRFQRWLNVEDSTYDKAEVWVSLNGTTKQTIWENGGEITDSSWVDVQLDISAIADSQPTVILGWTMGGTDSSWEYSGWNIDDVSIEGISSFTTYGPGCAGTAGLTPSLAGSGSAAPGGTVSIDLTGGLAGSLGFLFVGTSPDKFVLDGCTISLGPLVGAPFLLPLDGSGAGNLTAPLPGTLLPGTALFLQAAVLDAASPNGHWSLSNALELLLQ
ncbi:MAG: trypsin-like peptidase domain-containing protein [Planctomycetota bacterium]|nr:trypsin-like peptidase domain-containing protein [Planctomycetota bacterium]